MAGLKHYGVLGMHWGVTTKTSSEDHRKAASLRSKKRHELSNDELKILTGRLQLEKKHSELTKRELNLGERFVSGAVGGLAAQTVAALTGLASAAIVTAVIKHIKSGG